MAASADMTATQRRSAGAIQIREHRIPSANSAPYIAWKAPTAICGSAKAARPKSAASIRATRPSRSFALPTAGATPIGITLGRTAIFWFAQKNANKIGRITPAGAITEFPLPTPNAGPDAHSARARRQHLVLRNRSEPDRPHHAGRHHHRIQGRHHAGQQAAVDRGARRRAVVQRGRRRPRRPHHRGRRGHRISDPQPRQPAARHGDASGRHDLVRRDRRQRARPDRPRRQHSRISRCRRRTHRCAASPSAPTAISGSPRTSPTRSAAWRPTAPCSANTTFRRRTAARAASPRCRTAVFYFTQCDAGLIGEIILG